MDPCTCKFKIKAREKFMVEADYIVEGRYVLTMAEGAAPVADAAVVVKDGKVLDVIDRKSVGSIYRAKEIIGGPNMVVFPGLINTHTHAAMVYFRGLADDLPLKEWLEGHIWPAEGRWLSDEFVSDAVELACVEMLLAGVTAYNDMYFFKDAAARMTKECGMRAVLAAGVLDFPSAAGKNAADYLEKAAGFIADWKGDALITPAVAPHAPYTCCPDTFIAARALAEKHDVPLHTHLAETRWEVQEMLKRYGRTPVEHLENIGFLDERVIAAHCVHLTGAEIDILAHRKVGVSHCVESNLKLASGISPVVEMLKKGVNVTFGTDGAASNNDLDIISEMAIAARLHKAVSGDPTALDAAQALSMATRRGAEALGLGGKVGTLQKGKHADIVVANLNKPHLTPFYDIYSLVVYSMKSSDVDSVMVDGRLLVKDGKFLAKDTDEIMNKAWEWSRKIKAT
jgi:5-methylthioadenosine/S-adenosylhomocysteine deaminase